MILYLTLSLGLVWIRARPRILALAAFNERCRLAQEIAISRCSHLNDKASS